MNRVLLLAVLLAGCTGETLEDEFAATLAELADLDLAVVDGYPSESGRGVGTSIHPYLLFNRPLTASERQDFGELTLTRTDGTRTRVGQLVGDADGMGGSFEVEPLNSNVEYVLETPIPGDDRTFRTRAIAGPAWDLSQGLDVVSFGGAALHADLLQDTFEPGILPLWILRVTDDDVGQRLAFAPARKGVPGEDEHGWVIRSDYGYAADLRGVTLDGEGCFNHRQDGLFLPLWSGEDVVLLYLEDAHWFGCLAPDAALGDFGTMSLSGVLSTRWLLRLREAGGHWQASVDGLELDVDLNGNGTPDSATFALTMTPERVPEDELQF